MDYIFKRFNAVIIAIFVLCFVFALTTFFIRLYEMDKSSKALVAERAAFLEDSKKNSLIETTTDNMFREVLKTPSVEGLEFMQFYAVSIEDDTITLPEFKTLNIKYKHFIASRNNTAKNQVENQDLHKVKATID